jgi:hypothetical protein
MPPKAGTLEKERQLDAPTNRSRVRIKRTCGRGLQGKGENVGGFARPLTERARHVGENERLASGGRERADFALSATRTVLIERVKLPTNWPFPPKPGRWLSTRRAQELEVGFACLPKGDSKQQLFG